MLDVLFTLLFECFGELLLSVASEVLGHFLLAFGFGKSFNDPISTGRHLIRGALLGVVFGLFSVLVFSHPIITDSRLQIANLFLSPLFVGTWTACLGRVDSALEKLPSERDTFIFGAIFGFFFAAARFGLLLF